MSDSTHCQLLYSLLSSNAFLNMHALHFPTTFQMKMDVPYSHLYSLLPPLSSCLCSLQLGFICGWPNFQVWSILRCRGRLRDTKAHQQAGMDASVVPITVPTHPFARMNPSLSVSLCQTQLHFFVFTAPDAHTCTHSHRLPRLFLHNTIYCLVWTENWNLLGRLTDSHKQGGLLSIHNNYTSPAV